MPKVRLPEITNESLATVLEIISDGIWDWNANSGNVYRSAGWYTMLGYDIHSLDNTVLTWETLIHKDDYDRVMRHFEDYTTHKTDSYKVQYRCKTQSNDYIWIEDRARIVEYNDDGSVARMIGAHRDINAEKLLYEQSQQLNHSLQETVNRRTADLIKLTEQLSEKAHEAEKLANTDHLTGLSNRLHFENTLTNEAARAKRFNEPLSLIGLDLDNFKSINDTYGHASGDNVLKKVAHTLRQNVREIDTPVRWGGDEFIILLPNTTLAQATNLAEKLRSLILGEMNAMALDVTASFGVTQFDHSEEAANLTIKADDALYKAKATGGNKVILAQ